MKTKNSDQDNQQDEIDNLNLLKISTINYGEDGIYLTSEEISDLL